MGPAVTVVVPVRDEEVRIAGCLDALAASDLAHDRVEVLVVDGGSSDGTVDVARRLLASGGWWRAAVLHSAEGDRSSNLNRGLAEATAPVVVRVDARSRVPAHYLRRCLELLESQPDVAVVGGRQQAVAAGDGWLDAGVARALNNRWGMGLARYRRAGASGEADTVYLGAYRTDQLHAVGGWRTDLAVNEDFDLNRRLRRFGTVWFDADLAVGYLPRGSLASLARQYWAFGIGKARYWRVSGDRPQRRQVALLAAPVVGLAGLAAVAAVAGPAAAGGVLVAGALAAVAVEAVGTDGPRSGLLGHLAAVAALACVAGAWLAGVLVGSVGSVPRPVRAPA
jgi:glycosyltransferase involved in cell wall biosynthesis